MHIRIERVLLDLCGSDQEDQNTYGIVEEITHLFNTKYDVSSI